MSKANLMIAFYILLQIECYGQSWQFTRLTDNGISADSFSLPVAGSNSNDDFSISTGPNLALAPSTASTNDFDPPGSASAQSTSLAEALNVTAYGATIFAPTVTTTVSLSGSASSDTPKSATSGLGVEGGANAFSNGNYTLTGDITTGFLHGSIYLVGIVVGTTSGDSRMIGFSSVNASVNGFGVTAVYNEATSAWDVDADLPGFETSFTSAGVNNYFNFSIPVTLPMNLSLRAGASSKARVLTGENGDDGTAQVEALLSASAWAVYTPTLPGPLDGDFDGDGDVDGRDFLTWQRGFGADNGATLTQGDADHNGIVDSDDLLIWADNYGSSIVPLSTLAVVPETSSLILVVLAAIFNLSCCRFAARRAH